MQAFKNDEKVKDIYLGRVKAHAAADKIVKGKYWVNGKGCAVGCTIEGDDHSKYETELGIPKEVAYLEDGIFEELPNELAMTFPARFLEAVPVGADLSKVCAQMVVWQFEDEVHGLKNIKEVAEDAELMAICEKVVDAYKRVLGDVVVSDNEWEALYLEADKIYDARAGARARAWAWARAWAGAWARAGARAGARAWAGAGELYGARIVAMSDKFLELIKNAPIK